MVTQQIVSNLSRKNSDFFFATQAQITISEGMIKISKACIILIKFDLLDTSSWSTTRKRNLKFKKSQSNYLHLLVVCAG